MDQSSSSPSWTTATKAIVAVSSLALAVLVIWRFQELIQPLVLALLLAYLLNPVISLISNRLGLPRGTTVLAVYAILAVAVVVTLSFVGITTFQQAVTVAKNLPRWFDQAVDLVSTLPARLPESFAIGPLLLERDAILPQLPGWDEVARQLFGLVQPIFSRGGSIATSVVSATVNVLGLIFLVFIVSIYIANDIPRIGRGISNFAHDADYRADADRLMVDVSRVWGAYLRGQVVLGLVIFFVVSIVLAILGVDNALGLGLLSGTMEFLPVIGPLLGAGAAVVVALTQETASFGLSSFEFALVVLVAMVLIQQVENNLLVPRIVGDALNLHPLLVMVSVVMGASLAGLLGAVLAAPVVASLKILGFYAWRKMLDLPPFPEQTPPSGETPPTRSLLDRLRARWPRSKNQASLPPFLPSSPPTPYPLQFTPLFKDYLWGGRTLETVLGRTLPAGKVAESWEIAAHPNGQTRIAAGPLTGQTLSSVQQMWGEKLLGSRNRQFVESGRFPLLIKLLDANDWLSVQVHPDDAYALAHEGEYGKTEMWVVLHAQPGAELIYGLKAGVTHAQFAQAVDEKRVEELLHRVAVGKGDVVFVPAGTVHALGPGIVVAEIQQNSDATYRIYDWGRTGTDGRPRPLHVDKALEVIDWEQIEPLLVAPRIAPAGQKGVGVEEIAHCAYFHTERILIGAGRVYAGECAGESFEIWAILSGSARLEWGGSGIDLAGVSWVLLPASLGNYRIKALSSSLLLRVFTP
ncbi:MAG: AI-2E family transporter [Chloroflexi bacterium]|nr:MAG: AI-2E family transporter [Chloroflexota bacterium]